MPIRRELRKFYGREWRTVTRPRRILERAGWKCEQCGVPHGAIVARVDALPGWWFSLDGEIHDGTGALKGMFRGSELDADHLVTIKIGVAHLNHVAGDDRDENLRALCAFCHLTHDRVLHAETRATRKDAARPLLVALGAA
jgi:hypothetical protein